nr:MULTISPECIES: nuclear transport factor 2 family protein [Halomonas]
MERQGWAALSTEGDAARNFYASVLREDAVMLFPGGLLLEGKERILQSIGPQPWQTFQIEEVGVVTLAADAATLVYRVSAQRKGSEPYVALISSTYVREAGWKLAVHQHTPL